MSVILTFTSFGQENKDSEYKTTQFIIQLINDTPTKLVKVLGMYVRQDYSSTWLSKMSIENGMLTFQKGIVKHYWDVEDAILIRTVNERDGQIVFIQLRDQVGH